MVPVFDNLNEKRRAHAGLNGGSLPLCLQAFPLCRQNTPTDCKRRDFSHWLYHSFPPSTFPVCSFGLQRTMSDQRLCDPQLCLLSTQTSVRTAGRTREGQTVKSMSAHIDWGSTCPAPKKPHTSRIMHFETWVPKYLQTNTWR